MLCNAYHPDPQRPRFTPEVLGKFLDRWGVEIAGSVGLARQGAEAIARGSVLDGAMTVADAAIRARAVVDPSGRDLAARLLAAEACRQAALGRLRYDFGRGHYYGDAIGRPGDAFTSEKPK